MTAAQVKALQVGEIVTVRQKGSEKKEATRW